MPSKASGQEGSKGHANEGARRVIKGDSATKLASPPRAPSCISSLPSPLAPCLLTLPFRPFLSSACAWRATEKRCLQVNIHSKSFVTTDLNENVHEESDCRTSNGATTPFKECMDGSRATVVPADRGSCVVSRDCAVATWTAWTATDPQPCAAGPRCFIIFIHPLVLSCDVL